MVAIDFQNFYGDFLSSTSFLLESCSGHTTNDTDFCQDLMNILEKKKKLNATNGQVGAHGKELCLSASALGLIDLSAF